MTVGKDAYGELRRMNQGTHRRSDPLSCGTEVRPLGYIVPRTIFTMDWAEAMDMCAHEDGQARFLVADLIRNAALPLDRLPYTQEFESICDRVVAQVPTAGLMRQLDASNPKQMVWKLALLVRKAGRTKPFRSRRGHEFPEVPYNPVVLARVMPVEWSLRDRLPYSKDFTTARRDYDSRVRALDQPRLDDHEFWVAIVTEAKRQRLLDANELKRFDPDPRCVYPGQLWLYPTDE